MLQTTRKFLLAPFLAFAFLLGKNCCLSQSDEHRPLGVSYAELPLETANDVFRLDFLTSCEELSDDGDFLRLGLCWRTEVSKRLEGGNRGEGLTALPLVSAISFNFEKTNGSVRGFGLNSVFWLPLEFYTTLNELKTRNSVVQTNHRNEPQITLLLQLSLDHSKTSACRLCDSLDQQTLSDAQLNPDVVWA